MPLTPELAQWRKATRADLIARRLAAPEPDRAAWTSHIEGRVREAFPFLSQMVVGFCWPFQGEIDTRPMAAELVRRGGRVALPAVVAKGRPLEFREWTPDCRMVAGVYDLPVPEGTAVLEPDALLIPVVAIGSRGDRLGYGGGFFDRTLAALEPKPLSIALAFELSRLPTTDPQDHDILMDFVVSEAVLEAAVPAGLEAVTPDEGRRRALELARMRGLPRRRLDALSP